VDAAQQPRNFGFNDVELALKNAAEKFFADNLPTNTLHRLVAKDRTLEGGAECRWDPGLWKKIVDLGWLTVGIPERAGGLGMSAVAVAALVEQAGRAAFPGPLVPTLAAAYILAACESDAADTALALICEGKTFSYASCNRDGSWENDASEVRREGGVLNGSVYFVQDAQKVDYFLVNVRNGRETNLVVVPADAPGLSIEPNAIIDLTRDQARLVFDAVTIESGQSVAEGARAIAALETSTPARLVLISADICGACEWQLQTTAEYARTRKQFDRHLGFFQAVKHPLVEFMVALDLARGLLFNAACAVDYEPEMAEQYARMAKAAAGDAAAFGSRKSVQLHGGIGFTWECFVHVYLKRQMHNLASMGDATYQRARLAELVLAQ
jgi:alkylation response protein AidB-like acyl-CoA dehydrogenase